MIYLYCHPTRLQWAEGFAAGEQRPDDGYTIEIVTHNNCPPDKIYLTDKSFADARRNDKTAATSDNP